MPVVEAVPSQSIIHILQASVYYWLFVRENLW